MEIFWILGGLFIFVTLVFVTIALMWPEWVGITGKVAKQIESEHRGGSPGTELPLYRDPENPNKPK